jgi:hypothetical protein
MKWVKNLFGSGPNGWNDELVHKTFLPHDAEQVLKIKIPSHSISDTIAWHYEQNGVFSVKSAYKLAYSLSRGNLAATSNAPNGDRKIWQNIWTAPVPNKVRIFSWRLASDNLPTQKNKWRRTLELQNTCTICGNGTEDIFHAVVECTKAKALRHSMRTHWNPARGGVVQQNRKGLAARPA